MTVSSNIHIGLSTWTTNTAYTAGQRISNRVSGAVPTYAWVALSSGTSATSGTGPAASGSGTGTTVTDGSVSWKCLSTVDYTSLNAWQDSIPQTLVDNIVGLVWNNSTITTTDGVPFLTLQAPSGTQRSVGSFTITLKAAESFRDKLKGTNTALAASQTNGVLFRLPSSGVGGANYFDIYDSNFILDGLQFVDPYIVSNSTIINANASTTVKIQNCIIDGYAQPNGANMVYSAQSLGVSNCLLIDRSVAGTNGSVIISGAGDTTSYIVNNTFYRVVSTNGTETVCTAYLVNTAAVVVKNNLFVGWNNPVGGSGNAALVDHCATTSSGVGFATDNGSNLFNIVRASQFQSTSIDFHLAYTSSSIANGAVATTYIPSATDILGYARPQGLSAWSIGASEFTSQIVAKSTFAVSGSATLSTSNNASLLRTLSLTANIAAQQQDRASGTSTLGPLTLSAAGFQANITTTASSIGAISSSANLQQIDFASARVTFGPASVAQITTTQPFSAIATVGIVRATAAASQIDLAVAAPTLGPITTSSTFSLFVNASATGRLIVSAVAAISPTNVTVSATGSMQMTALIAARQETFANSTLTLALSDVISARQEIFAATVPANTTIGTVAADGDIQQVNFGTASATIQPSVAAIGGQSDLLSTVSTIGVIKSVGNANATYGASATVTIGPIVSNATAGQSDQATMAVSIGRVSSVVAVANPVPAVAASTIGPVQATVASYQSDNAAVTATIGPMVCVGNTTVSPITEIVLFGGGQTSFSATGAIDNPDGLAVVGSILPIAAAGVITNVVPLVATARMTIPITVAGAGNQEATAIAISTLRVFSSSGLTNAPKLRVSQSTTEILSTGGALRVSQAATEVLAKGGALRVSQTAIEVLARSPANSAGRVSQTTAEALAVGTPRALATQAIQEVLTGGAGAQNVRMSQVMTEVLTGGSTSQNVLISQVVLETLISAIPLKVNPSTFIMS